MTSYASVYTRLNYINNDTYRNNVIYNLLKFIAIIEEKTGVNDSYYDPYRKDACKYCKCKTFTSFNHQHEYEENFFIKYKTMFNIDLQLNHNDDNDQVIATISSDSSDDGDDDEKTGESNMNENNFVKLSEQNDFFDNLPVEIGYKIFEYCTHYSLITLTNVYPQYKSEIMNPTLWRYIRVDFCEMFFDSDQILLLLKHININLRYLSLKECKLLSYHKLDAYFKHIPKLEQLEMGRIEECEEFDIIIDLIVGKLKCLKFINLEWNNKHVSDIHVSKLTKLNNLSSIDISHCENVTDKAINELIVNLRKIVYFNIDGIQGVNDT